jgi:diguanylate cyclase (GGDEF)-like protein
LKKIERPVRHHEQELTVGASIGVAVYPDSGKEVEKLIEKADLAMYRAKKNPESNICYFE